MPTEYLDYLLIKELYHCTPSELDQQDAAIVEMHHAFIRVQGEQEFIQQKRAEQKAKLKS